jgi:hypothetical protein
VRDRGVAVQHLHVLEGDAQLVGDDLREGGVVALAVRRGPDDGLDLAGRVAAQGGRLPAAAGVLEGAGHLRRREPADLDVGGDPDAELLEVPVAAALGLLSAQPLVVDHPHGLLEQRRVVA